VFVDREAPTAPPRRRSTLTLVGRTHRRARRVAVEGAVAFHTGGGEQLVTGRLVELSATGLRLRSRARLAPSTAVMGVIELDEASASMEFLGEVVRVIDGDDPELAVRFLHLADPDMQRIDRLVGSLLRPDAVMRCGAPARRAVATTLPLGLPRLRG